MKILEGARTPSEPGGGYTFGGWYTKGWFGVRDVYWTRCVPLSESCTFRIHVCVYVRGGAYTPQNFHRRALHSQQSWCASTVRGVYHFPKRVYFMYMCVSMFWGGRTPSSIFTEGLSFHSRARVRGVYAFLSWCTVHVPYTKQLFGVRAVYMLCGSMHDPRLRRPWTYTMSTLNRVFVYAQRTTFSSVTI